MLRKLATRLGLAAMCLIPACASVLALETQDFSADWNVQALNVNPNADITKCPPPQENANAWTAEASLNKGGFVALPNGVKRNANNVDMRYNAWYKKTLEVPASWRGQSVRLYQEINYIDYVVFVNGKKAGVISRPFGYVELAPYLNFGRSNEIRIFATNCFYGTGYTHLGYRGRDEGYVNMPHFMTPLQLEVRSSAYVEHVYALTSVREKKLTLRCTVESVGRTNADISVAISEDAGRDAETRELKSGRVVKNASKRVQLNPGENLVEVVIPWDNPTTWEINRPHLYNAEVKLTANGRACDTFPKFVFGFREIWREGRDFILNGHVQRFRGFWNQGVPKDLKEVKKYGFTISYETHKHNSVQLEDMVRLEDYARAGVAIATGMPTIYYIHDAIRNDPEAEAQYRNHFKYWVRTMCNCPAVLWASCGVNQICPEENMRPEILGQFPGQGGVVLNIEHGCAIAREYHPNCLYFSHADGTNGDISSNNLYFNFTPLQEREEWLSYWAVRGIMPWYAAEFGAPYYACWFHDRTPQMTEWLAVYYGDDAYRKETEDLLRYYPEFARSCQRFVHGGWIEPGRRELYEFHPLAAEYVKMLIYRTNRAWRTYGLNGGLMYLTAWGWEPDNPTLNRQRLANCDIVTYLGGDPEFTDRTHAYYAGEEIRKNLVFVWDGYGTRNIRANWKFVAANGTALKQGSESVTLKQGEIVLKPISVTAPEVRGRSGYRFEVTFQAQDLDDSVATDTFPLEVYPKRVPQIAGNVKTFAVYDPEGKTVPLLDALGMKYTLVETVEEALRNEEFKHLLIGEYSLDTVDMDPKTLLTRVEAGFRILIMCQNASVWQGFGFRVEDAMARQLYNVSLSGVDDLALSHWRGAPVYGDEFGNIMKHATRRGPRGNRTHTLAGLVIKVPEKAGFMPLVRGEFDMNYTPLLRLAYGTGAVTFCTFDFQDRLGVCPAATETAAATFRSFFSDRVENTRRVVTSGGAADRIARELGLDFTPLKRGERLTDAVLLVGKDSQLDYNALQGTLGDRAFALVVANDKLATAARLVPPAPPTPKEPAKGEVKEGEAAPKDLGPSKFAPDGRPTVVRVTNFGGFNRFPFAGVGYNLLRWRDGLAVTRLVAANGYTVAGEGLFAISSNQKILFDQIEPGQLAERWKKDPNDLVVLKTVATSEEHNLQFLARVLHNWGVRPGYKTAARAVYSKPATEYVPISNYYVLGPWPSPQDDSVYMVETVFDRQAEDMAKRGDVNPNPRFHPKGLTYEKGSEFDFIDWRPTVQSDPDGFVNLRKVRWIDTQSFCTCYCVGYVERETAGNVTLRFGVDWRGKIWVNGQEVFKTYGGGKTKGAFIIENIPVKKGQNVFTFKIGSGQTACCFYANITKEIKPGDFVRRSIRELDDTALYQTLYPEFDPYMYVYW